MPSPEETLAIGVRPGDLLAGKYKVERVLGAGGMGVVVAAHHVALDATVAIKFLLPAMLAHGEAVARFAREARAMVKITSEHAARVLDVGTLETGAPYIVMEYLEGGDLAAWLEERGPLPIDQAVEFVLQACVAVAEAHGLGIVHRDLKPANLFCIRRPDGQLSVKVLDFGISKVTDVGRGSVLPDVSITKTSAVMGSALYMSPEQTQASKSAGPQSDIWALGVILYELLSGHVPFDGEAATAVAVKVATEPPPSLRGFRPDVPPGLEAVVLRCLEKDPRQRYPNVAELALALAKFAPKSARGSIERITGTIQAAGLSATALAMPPSPQVPDTVVSPGTAVPVGQTAPGTQGVSPQRWLFAALAVSGVLLVGGAVVVLVRNAAAPRPSVVASGTAPAALPSARPPGTTASSVAPGPATSEPTSTVPVIAVESLPQSPPATPPGARLAPRSAGSAGTPAAASSQKTPPSSPACDPSFTLDEQGRKHFKPECFLNKAP